MSAITEVQPNTPNAGRSQPVAEEPRIQISREESLGNLASGISMVAAVLVIVSLLIVAINWFNRPFAGVLLSDTLVVNSAQPSTMLPWAGFTAGLKPGDRIISVTPLDGQTTQFAPDDLQAGNKFNALIDGLTLGQVISVQIERPPIRVYDPSCVQSPTVADCTYQVVLGQFPLLDFLIQFGVGWVVGVLLILIGMFAYRTVDERINRQSVAILTMGLAVIAAGRFDLTSTYQLPVAWLIAMVVVSVVLITLTLTFPYRHAMLYTVKWLPAAPIVAGVLFGAALVALYLTPETHQSGIEYNLSQLLVVICAVILIAALIVRRRRAPTPIARERASLGIIGLVISVVPLVLWQLAQLAETRLGWTGVSFSIVYVMPPLIVFPLTMNYSMQQSRLFNSDRALNEGVIYGILGAVLIVGYVLFAFALFRLTSQQVSWNSPIPAAITLLVIAIGLSPARQFLEHRIDRAFMYQRRNYESRLEQFSRRLTRLTDVESIARELHGELMATIQPVHLFVYVRDLSSGEYRALADPQTNRPGTDIQFALGSPLLNYLNRQETIVTLNATQLLPSELVGDRTRLAVLDPAVIARMHSSSRLNGFLVLGNRRDQHAYIFEDLRYIEGLADQSALAIERAQVMAEAEHSDYESKILSQISTLLNMTMDYDTLLEFIYAQTARLLQLQNPNVYIALFAPERSELEMAFYEEDDARLTEREGYSWPLGDDLFSEVVQTQRPVRTDRYPVEAARRNMQSIVNNPALRAWMGVPLNAGSGSVLGTIAVASTAPNFSYSDDQLRLFTSVAELAASALEKARLLQETEQRARQLSVLNEISAQLASQYENVRALLETITNRAVGILGASIGALFLRDDKSDALNVTFAAGLEADKLIGTTIPVGAGIVGDAAARQEPVLINRDIAELAWPGELPVNLIESNRLQSVLAVPLIGRGGVLGILELINKQDGTQFVNDDINLLTTFASQAAIAIENARLYQLTDAQLAERVDQLNLMQRIDQELNRRLNLQAVTDLTLDNALRESHADAGALLTITLDPPQFTVTGSVGYPAGVFALGSTYSLDFGLPGRAYHSGRAMQVHGEAEVSFLGATLPGAVEQLSVPMASMNQDITVVLLLESKTAGTFTDDTVSFVTALVEHANTAIANAVLFEQLEHANTARNEFVGFVAHELKNPMTVVKGYVEFIIGGLAGAVSDDQKSMLDAMQRNLVRMQQIIEDLRDAAALETGQLKVTLRPINFSTVVIETLRSQQGMIDAKNQTLITDVPDELPTINGDPNRLIQVLTNFISNAIKYTPEGGTITVETTVEDNQWNPEMGRQVIHCMIQDTGYGMSPEDVAKLGSPYFRSDNPKTIQQPGTGLGMTITFALIREHHGDVWVESVLEHGTTFNFVLPIVDVPQLA